MPAQRVCTSKVVCLTCRVTGRQGGLPGRRGRSVTIADIRDATPEEIAAGIPAGGFRPR